MEMDITFKDIKESITNSIVIKRDGRVVDFNPNKIKAAINNAIIHVYSNNKTTINAELSELVEEIITKLLSRYGQELTINQIQRVTEEVLVASKYNEVAQGYISYRVQREQERMLSVDINESIKALTAKESTLLNENANKDSRVFNTQRDLTAGVTAKAIGLKMLPPQIGRAHV